MEVGSVWKLGLKLLLRDNGPLVGAIEKLALGFMRERHHRGGRLDMSLRSVGIAIARVAGWQINSCGHGAIWS